MNKYELAKWLHDNYEESATEKGWNTQPQCKVEFDDLPDPNKETMLEIADRILNSKPLHVYFLNKPVCTHENKYFVAGVFGGYWCPDCDRNVDAEINAAENSKNPTNKNDGQANG